MEFSLLPLSLEGVEEGNYQALLHVGSTNRSAGVFGYYHCAQSLVSELTTRGVNTTGNGVKAVLEDRSELFMAGPLEGELVAVLRVSDPDHRMLGAALIQVILTLLASDEVSLPANGITEPAGAAAVAEGELSGLAKIRLQDLEADEGKKGAVKKRLEIILRQEESLLSAAMAFLTANPVLRGSQAYAARELTACHTVLPLYRSPVLAAPPAGEATYTVVGSMAWSSDVLAHKVGALPDFLCRTMATLASFHGHFVPTAKEKISSWRIEKAHAQCILPASTYLPHISSHAKTGDRKDRSGSSFYMVHIVSVLGTTVAALMKPCSVPFAGITAAAYTENIRVSLIKGGAHTTHAKTLLERFNTGDREDAQAPTEKTLPKELAKSTRGIILKGYVRYNLQDGCIVDLDAETPFARLRALEYGAAALTETDGTTYSRSRKIVTPPSEIPPAADGKGKAPETPTWWVVAQVMSADSVFPWPTLVVAVVATPPTTEQSMIHGLAQAIALSA